MTTLRLGTVIMTHAFPDLRHLFVGVRRVSTLVGMGNTVGMTMRDSIGNRLPMIVVQISIRMGMANTVRMEMKNGSRRDRGA